MASIQSRALIGFIFSARKRINWQKKLKCSRWQQRELMPSRQKQQLRKAFIEGEQACTCSRHREKDSALQKQDLGSQKFQYLLEA